MGEKKRSDGDIFKEHVVDLWTFLPQDVAGAKSLNTFKGQCPSSQKRNPLCVTKTSETTCGLGNP